MCAECGDPRHGPRPRTRDGALARALAVNALLLAALVAAGLAALALAPG